MCECRQYRRDEQTKRTINNSDYDTIVQIGSGNEGDVSFKNFEGKENDSLIFWFYVLKFIKVFIHTKK